MIRIGSGYDVHKLVEGRKLIIGGVDIPHTMGLLGAAAMGDIGCLFPDSDEKYKGADSLELLREVVRAIGARGWHIVNIDSTVAAQAPKLRPYIDEMRRNIADACSLDVSCVSVKATTEEGLGFTGRREGISASAVCLIEK